MKKQFFHKLSFKKETVTNLAGQEMGEALGGISGIRSVCICMYTDRCPTTNGWICQETCGYISSCGAACNSNPCC